jgi:hypothetical protein
VIFATFLEKIKDFYGIVSVIREQGIGNVGCWGDGEVGRLGRKKLPPVSCLLPPAS